MAVVPRPLSLVPRRFLIIAATAFGLATVSAQETTTKLTYDDHIRPLLENKCFSCHNPDKKKGGLDMTSFGGLISGGGGGAVVDPGNPAGSRLWTCSTQKEEPFMPPEGSPLPAKDLALLSKWIADGVLQSKGSVARASTQPKVDLSLAAGAGKPSGPVARPENVLLQPVVVTPRLTAVTAMAASPWTSLLAVAGQKQILLYDTDSRELTGVLPYPEGYARSLKFSANGSLLILGGGRGGKFGHTVVWDVKTGRRVTELGKEFDQLMSADISPDHKRIAFGTNTKRVKCYDTSSGELLYTISKHTEWVTGADFSPDGILLATADRNGNVMVWEAENGGEFFNLGQHKASVTDLSWRPDSNVLASCAADGTISTWELKTGKRVATWSAHGAAVQSVSFTPDGRLLSCGNDGTTALWTIEGKRLPHARGVKQGDIVSKVVALADAKVFVTGNWLGEVRFFDVETGADLTGVSVNPPKLEERIALAEKQLQALQARVATAPAEAAAATERLQQAEADQAAAMTASQAARVKLEAMNVLYQPLSKRLEDLRAALTKAPTEVTKAELTAKIKTVSDTLAPLRTERRILLETMAEVTLDLEWLATRVTELQAKLKSEEGSLSYFDKLLSGGKAEDPERIRKSREAQALIVEGVRTQITKLQARLPVLQAQAKALNELRSAAQVNVAFAKDNQPQITGLAERVAFLRAAEFNVGVLAEQDQLLKLETDLADAIAAQSEHAGAVKQAATRVVTLTQSVAQLTGQLQPLELSHRELFAGLPALEASLVSFRQADAEAAGKVEAQVGLVGERQALLGEQKRQRDGEVATAKAAVEEYARVMRPVRVRLEELTAQVKLADKESALAEAELSALTKSVAESRTRFAKADQVVGAQLAAATAAELRVQRARTQVQAAATAAEATQGLRGLLTLRYFTTQPAVVTQLATALAELATAEAAREQTQASRFAAMMTFSNLNAQVSAESVRLQAAQTFLAEQAKTAGPVRAEAAELAKTRVAQQKEYAAKQLVPAAIAKAYEAKLAPLQTSWEQALSALPPLEQLATVAKNRLVEAAKPVDAKKLLVVAATKARDEAQAKLTTAQKALAAAVKEGPLREKAMGEASQLIATLSPQVEPLRQKVKAAEAAYFARLPKRPVAQQK